MLEPSPPTSQGAEPEREWSPFDELGDIDFTAEEPDPVCPTCGKRMINLGNVSGTVFTSEPVQWDEVWVCRADKLKKTLRVHGDEYTINRSIDDYREVQADV